jgi:hypothetical protein
MPKFSVTYSVNNLYEIIVEATDKEDAISQVDGGHGGKTPKLLDEEYLGINVVKDVTHECPHTDPDEGDKIDRAYEELRDEKDSKPKAKNPR